MIQNMIEVGFAERKPATYFDILDALQYRCRTISSSDTLRQIIRRMEAVKTVIGVPMEAERAAVDPAEIHHWFDDLTRALHGVPRELIFNIDETGCSEYRDAHEI
jgi:ABC-type hemin transport system substrate-binding protein